MTEFIVRYNWDGSQIELGIAVPGFDGRKWSKADKYWVNLSLEEATDLGEKIHSLTSKVKMK